MPLTKPNEKSYEELVEAMEKHHNSTSSEIVQRYKFNSCFRKESESIVTYLSELRLIAQHCNFRDNLDDMLRDSLMCGVENKSVQKRLLGEAKLTLKKCTKIALAMETAEKNAGTLQNTDTFGGATCEQRNPVHQLHLSERGWQSGEKSSEACYRCGQKSHNALKCPYKEAKCHMVKWDT